MSAFGSVAEFYEVLSDGAARLGREGPLLEACYRRAPGTRAVDLACGSGIHAEFLAKLGAQVAALDLGEEMIAHAARRRPHPNIVYRQADMRRPGAGPWDFALCLGNSLSLLASLDEVEETLRAVRAALSPGGFFVLQILNYLAEAAKQPRHRVERKSSGGREVVAVKSLVPENDRTLLSLAFFAKGEDGYTSVSETCVLLHIDHDTLADIAARAGFEVQHVYGGFDRSAYSPESSPDVVAILQKA